MCRLGILIANQPWFAFTVVSKRDRCLKSRAFSLNESPSRETRGRRPWPPWSALEPVVQPSWPSPLVYYGRWLDNLHCCGADSYVESCSVERDVAMSEIGRGDVEMLAGAKPCRPPTRARPAEAVAPKAPPLGGPPDATMTRILLPHPVLVRRRRCKSVPASPQRQCPVARRGTVGLC